MPILFLIHCYIFMNNCNVLFVSKVHFIVSCILNFLKRRRRRSLFDLSSRGRAMTEECLHVS